MDLGPYRINLDALLARLVYRWRGCALAATVVAGIAIALASGQIPPLWRGRAALAIVAPPDATVLLDGQLWPHAVYAGAHTVVATMPDGRSTWADITLRAGQQLTLTLPTDLTEPRERSLPPAAPGSHIAQVWWADGAWRVQSIPDPLPLAKDSPGQSLDAMPTAPAGQTVAVSRQGIERLSTLDAYAGLADQVHVHSQLIQAVYHPNDTPDFADRSTGTIEVRGW